VVDVLIEPLLPGEEGCHAAAIDASQGQPQLEEFTLAAAELDDPTVFCIGHPHVSVQVVLSVLAERRANDVGVNGRAGPAAVGVVHGGCLVGSHHPEPKGQDEDQPNQPSVWKQANEGLDRGDDTTAFDVSDYRPDVHGACWMLLWKASPAVVAAL